MQLFVMSLFELLIDDVDYNMTFTFKIEADFDEQLQDSTSELYKTYEEQVKAVVSNNIVLLPFYWL